MKKLIALLLAVLTLSGIPCAAYAAGDKQNVVPTEAPVQEGTDETQEYYWEDLEPYLETFGLKGQFYSLTDFGLDMWVPDDLEFQELTDEEIEEGLVAYATDADEKWKFMIVNLVYDQEIESLEEWQDILEKDGIKDSVICYVNDLTVLEYLLPEEDSFVCDLHLEDGSILEFIWEPFSDEAYAVSAGFMSNSLMLPTES